MALALFPGVLGAAGITVKGSDTMVLLCQKWAETYMHENSGVDIQVTGGGSGTGIAALRNNATDIASASRQMKPEEVAAILASHGERPMEIKTAMDGICVFVNDDNPLKEISFAQLDRIFRGEIKNWSEVGGPDQPIVVYSRENSSGTYAYFKELILKDRDYTARALTMPGTAALINAISKDKNGIGYGGVGYASGVKVLAVKAGDKDPAVLPSDDTIRNNTYPISRYLYFYVLPSSNKGTIAQFINWVLGAGGQAVVKEIGYFPLSREPLAAQARESQAPAPAPVAPVSVAEPVKTTTMPAAPVATMAPAAPVATVVYATPAPSPSPAMTATSTTMLDNLIEREVMLAKREMAASLREDSLAKREAELAEQEKQMTAKAKELDQRGTDLKNKEDDYAVRRAKHPSWWSDAK
ncbi:MAG TPA: phosphate ABC transporter substrate-binding protein PstS family protein [Verrucomicrobiae bacterium]